MAQEQTYLTLEGLRALEEELEHLRRVKRQEVAGRIHEAKETGEQENSEYDQAKKEQAFVEGRIQELEFMIRQAVIIPDHRKASAKSDTVELGSIVKVQSLTSNKKGVDTYTIVGSLEASPQDGRISNESPIGKALLGKKAGDVVEFKVPSGIQRLKIISVR